MKVHYLNSIPEDILRRMTVNVLCHMTTMYLKMTPSLDIAIILS